MSLKGGRRSGRRGRWEVKGTRGREELSVLAEIGDRLGSAKMPIVVRVD